MSKYFFRIFTVLIFLQPILAKALVHESIDTSHRVITNHTISKGVTLESVTWFDNFILDEDEEEHLASEKKGNSTDLFYPHLSHFKHAELNNHIIQFKDIVMLNNTRNPLYILWSALLI